MSEHTKDLEQSIIEKIKLLSFEKQREVFNFIKSIENKKLQKNNNLKGIWSDLNIDIDESEIKEIRKEMWKNFPRDTF